MDATFEGSISQYFERRLSFFADRMAIDDGPCSLTYRGLNQRANAVAKAILEIQAEAAEPVALLLEHGAPAIIGVLGTLKAGKIYVPVDPSFPSARNEYVLRDSQATLIVTNTKNLLLAKSLAKGQQQILNMDEIHPGSAEDSPVLTISPDSPAYILSTSGSTGEPKGVVQTHRNVLAVVQRYTNGLQISAADRLSLFPSYSVTASVSNSFGALLNGACLCPFNLKERGVAALAEWLVRKEVSIYHSVPTVFRHFVATLTGEEQFPKLRLIRTGGEPLTRRDVELYRKHFSPDCVLINGYGSSEISNVWQYRVDKDTVIPGERVPVGWPIDDTAFQLVDDRGDPVASNEVGEIVIKSRGLSPGYWKKPEPTEAVFESSAGGERMYHTGDLGYLLPDGCLVHVGRKDFQVKIRGYRVEVGEIESALLNSESVKETVVVAREDGNGDQQLVAYVVLRVPAEVAVLRRILKEKLPEHMVPAAFVFLDALPLTSNGKLDRTALPAPAPAESEAGFVEPQTVTERSLAKIYADVLGIRRVGLHDDFFAIGGHSLSATQVISRVRQAFHTELSVATLFEHPTVHALSLALDQSGHDLRHALPEIVRRGQHSTYPASYSQQRLWFLHQFDPGLSAYNIAQALRITGELDMHALQAALNAIVNRHQALRTTFASVGGTPVQVVGREKSVPLPLIDLSKFADPTAEANRRTREISGRAFDLSTDLMLRATLFRLGTQEHSLLIVVHHIAFDYWSVEIFFHELSALYEEFHSGKADSLPELPVQYTDFAEWQRETVEGPALEKELSYWRRKLAGAPASLDLPGDYRDPQPRVSAARLNLSSCRQI
jgi:amino acid adenylation domain-containing protein